MRTLAAPLAVALTLALPLALACGSTGENPPAGKEPSATATQGQQAPTSNVAIKPTTIAWTAPASFALVPSPSPMRLATYKFAKAEGDTDDGEMTVSQVGGGVESNINRWKGQLEASTVREETQVTVGDLKVSLVWIEGTYKGMSMPGMPSAGPKEGYALLGAAVSRAGQDEHYFKLTGPKKTIEAARPAFDELIQSLAPSK